jgi:hypothetical protein
MNYQPEPSSVAARVIAYLGNRPAGSAVTNAELSHQLGVPSSAFDASLKPAVNAGLVHKHWPDSAAGRSTSSWVLGPRVVPAAGLPAQEQEPDHGDVVATTVHEPEPSAPAPAEPVAEETKDILDAQEVATQAPAGFACALFNDGRLYLELGDETMTLQVEHTRALLAYLERVAMP